MVLNHAPQPMQGLLLFSSYRLCGERETGISHASVRYLCRASQGKNKMHKIAKSYLDVLYATCTVLIPYTRSSRHRVGSRQERVHPTAQQMFALQSSRSIVGTGK